jgi:hypothetical protein
MNSLNKNLCDLRAFVAFVKSPWAVRLFQLQLVAALAAGLAGCASAQAKSKPADRPALIVPPAPPRVIEPAPEAPEPVSDLPNTPSVAPSNPGAGASRTTGRTTAPKPEAAKPDPKAPDPKPVEQPPVEPVAQVPTPPAAQLRTPETADASSAARGVQTTIDRARGLLNSVSFAPLSNDRKKVYNDAKLLIQQAEDSLKRGNLGIAQGVANKAETLAKELAGR